MHGILSVVRSVYDSLGMAAPFILPVDLLQDLSRKGLGWDDNILDYNLTPWRVWLNDLLKISHVTVGRCVKPIMPANIDCCESDSRFSGNLW